MNKQLEGSGVNFVQTAPNYLLLGFAALVIVCLFGGMLTAFNSSNSVLAAIFLISAAGILVFSLLHWREAKKLAVGKDNQMLDWEIIPASRQRDKLNTDVRELARILEIDNDQMSDLLSAYIVAEDLALRQIQQEAKIPLVRHVSLADVPFEAILVKKELITCIETIFLVTPNIGQEKINTILRKTDALKNSIKQLRLDSKVRLLLVLITQIESADEAELRSEVKTKFAATPVDVDIRLLDFEELQKTYAME